MNIVHNFFGGDHADPSNGKYALSQTPLEPLTLKRQKLAKDAEGRFETRFQVLLSISFPYLSQASVFCNEIKKQLINSIL